MTDFQSLSFTVIGNGALGGALTDLLNVQNCRIRSVYTSRSGTVYKENGEPQKTDHSLPLGKGETGDVIFICVPDDEISVVARQLSVQHVDWSRKSLIHCSGNLNSDELNALKEKGAKTASMHPLQTFQRGDRADRFYGVYVSLEGNRELCDELEKFLESVGSKPLRVRKEQKQILHIAAVFASNYAVAVLHEAEHLLNKNEVEKSLKPLEPLIRQTVFNALQTGPTQALSGPIARGDEESIRKHLMALAGEPESEALYKALGLKTVDIAREKGTASKEKLDQIEQLFRPNNSG